MYSIVLCLVFAEAVCGTYFTICCSPFGLPNVEIQARYSLFLILLAIVFRRCLCFSLNVIFFVVWFSCGIIFEISTNGDGNDDANFSINKYRLLQYWQKWLVEVKVSILLCFLSFFRFYRSFNFSFHPEAFEGPSKKRSFTLVWIRFIRIIMGQMKLILFNWLYSCIIKYSTTINKLHLVCFGFHFSKRPQHSKTANIHSDHFNHLFFFIIMLKIVII